MRILLSGLLFMCAHLAWAQLLHDPTKPEPLYVLQGPVDKKPSWSLNYILYSPSRKIAQINNQFVRVGSTINNYRVVKITPYAVFLQAGQTKFTLVLPSFNIKNKP